jgi:hypothetical protein
MEEMNLIKKKNQIIQGYIDEILPYVDYKIVDKNLQFQCELKLGSTAHIQCKKIKKYINYTKVTEDAFLLDFSDSSIKDSYRGLTLIHKEILEV